nr:putative reverse transcriptase domain-containing protein [Tanacetum cinerariifolium]
MKFCFNSSQFFACSGDVLSNHLLATPNRVRWNTRKSAESFVLNRQATSSTFLICSIAFSVELPYKVVLRNSLKNCPLISNVAFSGLLILLRVLLRMLWIGVGKVSLLVQNCPSGLAHEVATLEVLERIGDVAYKLDLPEELSRVHNMFHMSNLKKCHADEPLAVPLDGLHFDDKLQFVEEPVEILDREVKRLKRSRISLVKVRWNSKRGPEFTWEREDQLRKKYPHLFARTASTSTVTS